MSLPALQLDLLTVVGRLEQIRDELAEHGDDSELWRWLLEERVLTCDLPRLRGHLTAEARALERWANPGRPAVDAVAFTASQPIAPAAELEAEDRARAERDLLGRVLAGLRRL